MTDAQILKVMAELFSDFRTEIKADMADFKSEIRSEITGLKSEMADFKSEIRSEMADLKSEMSTMMDEKLAKQSADLKDYIKHNNVEIGEVLTQALEDTYPSTTVKRA